MKPNDLQTLYKFEDRRVYIDDSVLFIPDYVDFASFSFPGWESIFQNGNPVHVEYCSGNGHWIIAKAQENPQLNWVAVDYNFERVRKIWSKMKNRGIKNLFIICGDGKIATKYYFPKNSIQRVYINFPDPWPKNSHAKNRIMQRDFLEDVLSCMAEEAAFTLVTDDENYSKRSILVMNGIKGFQSAFPHPCYVLEYSDYGTSYFEELFRSQGKTIRYHEWFNAK